MHFDAFWCILMHLTLLQSSISFLTCRLQVSFSMWRPASLVQLYDILGEDLYKECWTAKGECRWMYNVTTIVGYFEYDLDLDQGYAWILYTMCSKTAIDGWCDYRFGSDKFSKLHWKLHNVAAEEITAQYDIYTYTDIYIYTHSISIIELQAGTKLSAFILVVSLQSVDTRIQSPNSTEKCIWLSVQMELACGNV